MSSLNSSVRICEIRDIGQLPLIETLAWKIFPKTYQGLIPDAQIPYMMDLMYGDEVMRKELAGGMCFAVIFDDAVPVGYISWHLAESEEGRLLRLEKLYLDFALHGRGIGRLGLEYVIREAEQAGVSYISLNVNKGNLRAQKAYMRAGFYKWRTEKEPVGNGFFKDDYIMRYDVGK